MRASMKRVYQQGPGQLGDASTRSLIILAAVALGCAFLGGSSRATAPTLVLLRPLLCIALVALLVQPGVRDWRGLRAPLILLVFFAFSMLLQLIPIPASWWLALSGRARYAPGVLAGGSTSLPVSLSPDLTINSLLSLMPAACVLLAYAGMRSEHRRASVWVIIALAGISILLALAQLGGAESPAYFYKGHQDALSGMLANRNHQAVLLDATLPLLAAAARWLIHRRHGKGIALALAAAAIVIVPIILLTGSRQGFVLGLVSILAAILIAPRPAGRRVGRLNLSNRTLTVLLMSIAVGLVVLAIYTGRAVSIDRLSGLHFMTDDARWRNLPFVLEATRDFLPWGSGYGTFDVVYRGFEPDVLLHSSYFNHAHNDLIELAMTGGGGALMLLAALLVHIAWRAVTVIGSRKSASTEFLSTAALVMVTIILAASLVDYPLRTPVMSVVFMLAMCWLSAPPLMSAKVRVRLQTGTRSASGE